MIVPATVVTAGALIVCAAHAEVSIEATAMSPAPRSTTADSGARGTSMAGSFPVPSAVAAMRTVPTAAEPAIVPAAATVPTTVTCAPGCAVVPRFTGVAARSQLAVLAYWIATLEPNAPVVGASGAIFGLLSAGIVVLRARGINPMQSGLGFWLLLNLLFTFTTRGISIGGHLGGLVGGALAAIVLYELAPRLRLRGPAPALVVAALGAIAVAGSLAIS